MIKALIKFSYLYFSSLYSLFFRGNTIKGVSFLQILLGKICIMGEDNTIVNKTRELKARIIIHGNNHHLLIGEGVIYKKGCIWFEDQGCSITVDDNTTIEEAYLSVAEGGTSISIGKDCMFSKAVYISTTDSHSIINNQSGRRTNFAKSIMIGNHVWIGRNSTINKGVTIFENSVVAGNSVVTHNIPSNVIVAGIPGVIVKENIQWDRERLS